MPDTSPSTTEQRLVQVLLRATQTALRCRMRSSSEVVRREADAALELAFAPVWERVTALEFGVGPDAIQYAGTVVLDASDDQQGLIAAISSAGIVALTLVPGAEIEEIKLVLTAVTAARSSPGHRPTDLLTSLFRADLQHIHYRVDDAHAQRIASASSGRTGTPDVVRETVRQDASAPSIGMSGVVQLEKFDSTLYFLDEREIEYLRSSIDREYARDLALGTLSLLLDILELRTEAGVRDEVIGILADFLPELLREGRFEAVAYLVSGVREVSLEAEALSDPHKEGLDRLRASISHPRAISQLFHALEGGAIAPTPESLGVLLRELRPAAIRRVLTWGDRLSDPRARGAVAEALDSFFTQWPHSLSRMVAAREREVVQASLALASRLKLPEFVETVGALSSHHDEAVRRMAAEALAAMGSSASLRRLSTMAEDVDQDVRVVVYRTFAVRPFRGALRALRHALEDKDLEEKEQREKRALFEAFGAVAGSEGVSDLTSLLGGRNAHGRRVSSHTRACAATALGVVGTRDARAALERAADDRDPLVRQAVSDALRGNR